MMKWSITPELQRYCSGHTFDILTFDPEYHHCMKTELPSADVVTLHLDRSKMEIDWDNYQVDKEDPPTTISSYASACYGDSGSGQFITNGFEPEDEGKFRFILSAIFRTRSGSQFKDDKGEQHQVPCGSYTFDQKWSTKGK